MTVSLPDVEARARLSLGASGDPIYRAVADAIADRHPEGGTLIDVGCGAGNLWGYLGARFDRYLGVDAVRYEGLPDEVEFLGIDLDTGRAPLPDAVGDVVAAVETIEHLENPRAFARELTRLTRPGGWIIVTTPNQLSLLSKLTLVVKNEFNAFQAGSYPAHLTALLESDLRRIGAECGWVDAAVAFTLSGRIPGTAGHWPRWLSRLVPRGLSDNILMIGRKPAEVIGPAGGERDG
ncbi:MAG: class I SAM-dependent methyltransferase [Isosphaeraceae bacterium]